MHQLTQEEAIKLAESEVWKEWSDEQIVMVQLYQRRLVWIFPDSMRQSKKY